MLRRLLLALFAIWLAATLAFVALRALPGDGLTAQMVDSGASAADLAALRSMLGLDAPLPVQYLRYLGGLARGDLGTSLLSGQPVTEMIAQRLPSTLTLAGAAMGVAVVVALTLGLLAATNRPVVSTAASFAISLILSTPIYWTGTLAIYVFTVELNLLPSSGSGRPSQLVLPALVLGVHSAGAIARVVRAAVGEARQAPFARTARAKGLSEPAILVRHVLRAGLLPVVTVLALQAGFLVGGVVITEALFVRPGLGRLLLDATLRQDYPVVQGVVVLAAVVYAILHALTDALYRVLDPRVAS